MREIKFRIINPDGGVDYITLRELFYETYSKWSWDDLKVSEYVGIDDKNGTPIFEGDILKTDNERVIEADMMWAQYLMHAGLDSFYCNSDIIGNIYQNPELLGAK